MTRTAISRAIEVLAMQCAGRQPRHLVAAVDVQADRIEVDVRAWPAAPSATPRIGSFGEGGHAGNSAPDFALVAGVSNCLTLDAQREKAGNAHYGNRIAADREGCA